MLPINASDDQREIDTSPHRGRTRHATHDPYLDRSDNEPQSEQREAAIPTPREILKQTADALERTLRPPVVRSEWYIG